MGLQDLLEKSGSNIFVEELGFDDPVKQLATRAQLRHEVHIGRILKVLVQLDYVRVVKRLQNPDLCLETVPVLDFGACDDLDGSFLTSFNVRCTADLTIGTFAELLRVKKARVKSKVD